MIDKWSPISVFIMRMESLVQLEKKERIIKYKILYTFIILMVYLLGKGLPLYMIDLSSYMHDKMNAENLLMQTINGDVYRCSIFALGISPFMISSIIVQIMSLCRNSEYRSKVSPKKTNKLTLLFTIIVAFIQAIVYVQELIFKDMGQGLLFAKSVAVIEMITGVAIILWLISRNKKYGIGGQSLIILVNIIDGMMAMLKGIAVKEVIVPLILSFIVIIITIIMENTEKRIPVQRISIHNIYADKNYIAIKLNPIGVMPAMFSTALFMVPQLLVTALNKMLPNNRNIMWLCDNMTLTRPLGIVIYISGIYAVCCVFSRVFINPGDITEQYLKSGDSLVGLHAGSDTKKYLSKTINRISLFSASIMTICLIAPIILQLIGVLDEKFSTFPSMAMMMTGIWCNVYREYKAIRDLEAYKPFI